jgi:hypothetical protein
MPNPSTLAHDTIAGLRVAGSRPAVDRSRLAVYSILGASAGALPLPWIPDVLANRVRGALVHDVAARHGVSLTPEARAVLSEPWSPRVGRGLAAEALSYVGVRLALRVLARFGPVGLVWPLRYGLRTYVLGHLFDRYLDTGRTERAVRIDAQEAQRVRQAVEGAILRAVTVDAPAGDYPTPIDDQRDASTAMVDGVLRLAAGLPDRLARRLEMAFDELLSQALMSKSKTDA